MKDKRGELTSTEIISIVFAIAGLIIVLFVLAIVYDGSSGEDQRELCRLSVLTRASAPFDSVQASVPLKCATEKICISSSGKKDACPEFIGEDNVRTVKIGGEVKDQAYVIESEYADAMYLCWSMMGKGQLNVFKNSDRGIFSTLGSDVFGVTGKVHPTCVVCSRVALGSDVSDDVRNSVDVNRYMAETAVPGSSSGLTYLQVLTDPQLRTFPSAFYESKSGGASRHEPVPNQTAFVFMQILSNDAWEAAGNAASRTAFVVGGAAVGTPLGWVTDANIPVLIGKAVVTLLSAGTAAGVSAWNADSNQQLAAGYCGELTGEGIGDGARSYGCSLTKALEYNVNNVNSFCQVIEGSP